MNHSSLRPGRSLFAVASLTALVSFFGSACSGTDEPDGSGSGTSAGGAAASSGQGFADGSSGTGVECTVPCETGEICSHGVCVEQGTCSSDGDCQNDSYCDEPSGLCLPWRGANPAHDPGCIQASVPGVLTPKLKCEFSVAPAGDPFPGHVDVQGTPVVVNFHNPSSDGPPSIAASFTATVPGGYTEDQGVIRVLRGDTCAIEVNLGGTDVDGDGIVDWTVSSASLAVADLDGDAVAEIVAYAADGSTLAFTDKSGVWSLLWKATYPAGAPWSPCDPTTHGCSLGWAGVSIHDLDDDGVPEVIREGVVFDGVTGALKALAPPGYGTTGVGAPPVLANLDQDANVELTNGEAMWEWLAGGWSTEPTFTGTPGPGFAAVADFGAYGAALPSNNAEIAVVQGSAVTVFAADGAIAMPPVAVPGAGGGGPPTISDFDGDGLPEVGVAGQAFYTVYDIDCGPTPRPGGTCNLGPCDFAGGTCTPQGYVLWSRSTQDLSSNITGSSIFDFEADGKSEVVYADECFTRVYDGPSGDVLFSQYRSSCTWLENPIVADTDGNFRADLVTPSNKACAPEGSDGISCAPTLNADGVDPQFNGLHCKSNSDCTSNLCDQGFCRCTTGSECCAGGTDALCLEAGFKCVAPNAGTPGTGNTCRAAHPHGVSGIKVYSDANDAWVRSRTIWSQHAYAVTHIGENGVVPKTSDWMNNWEDPTLNNFRQNVPGDPNGSAVPDDTAGAAQFDGCGNGVATLSVDICNRGAAPEGAGVVVGFYVAGVKVCEGETSQPLDPEQCELVSCAWSMPPATTDAAVDVDVIANDGGAVTECEDGNNHGTITGVYCQPPS